MATLRFYVCFMLTFTLVVGQSPYYVLKAREAILTPALTKPLDDILWKHNGETVITFDSAEERVFAPYHDRVLLAWDTAQLTITDVRYEDSGEYELDANVNGRLYRSQYMLKVLDKVSKPVITCEMSDDESSSNSSTAVRATLSCSSESMTPEALKFTWNLEGKSHLGPALPIALGNNLDDITYSCTANNPLQAETSVFTAKDCYTEKSSQVLDILVPIIIASLILLAFCLFPFIFRHQIKRACFMNGKNNDLEKQPQAAAADSAQNNEERKPFLKNDIHRQETIPSQQRLPKQSSVIEKGHGGKVQELCEIFEPNHPKIIHKVQKNGNVGPASPSSRAPKTSADLMSSGGKSALNFDDHQNIDADPNHSDPEEYQDALNEAEPKHTDQVQQNMEPTSGGQLNSDQAESEADETTWTRDQQDDTQSTNKGQDVTVEGKQESKATDLTLTGTASKQTELLQSTAAPVLPVKSGCKEQTDSNEETNTDMVVVDPQKNLSKKETMALMAKEPEMNFDDHQNIDADPNHSDPEEYQDALNEAEPKHTDQVQQNMEPTSGGQLNSDQAESEADETTWTRDQQDDTQSTNKGQDVTVEGKQESKATDLTLTGTASKQTELLQSTAAPVLPVKSGRKEQTDANEETNTDMVLVDPQKNLSKKETMALMEKEPEMSREHPAQSSSPPDQVSAAPEVTQRPDRGEDSGGGETAPQKDPKKSESAEEPPPGLAKKSAQSDALSPQSPVQSSSSQDQDSKPEDREKEEEAEPTLTDQVQQNMEPTLLAQSSSPPDQGLAAPEVRQETPQKDPKKRESAEEEELGLAKKAEKPDALSPQAPVQSSSSQDQDSKPEDREKEAQTNGNVGPATSQHASPNSCAAGGEPDINSEDHQNHTDPAEYQDARKEAESTHADQVQQNMEPTLSAQSSSPPDQGLAAPEVRQETPQKDPKKRESAEEEELGLSKKAEKPGWEAQEQESTHPPDSTLSLPADENKEPKDVDAEPKDEADKAPHVKLDADNL